MKEVIPIKLVDLGDEGFHIFCSVVIENMDIHSLIDTGANKSVISSELASKLTSLEEFEMEDSHTAGIGKEDVEATFVILEQLHIGQIDIKQQVIGILDLDHVVDMYEKMEVEPFQMIIGGDILSTHKAIIDYGSLTITLEH
jgi:hypothetical protein